MRLAGYAFWVGLSIAVLFIGMRLDQADLSIPLAYHGDALLILPLVKCTVETGTHWRNEKLGAPGIQELHDFPIVDHFHFALLWLIGQCSDYLWAFNLYYLAGYPLAVLTTMIVLRAFGMSFAAAGLAGMLFAFLPYHWIRGLGHYFLSAYWTLPLSLWPVLRLLWGQRLFNSRITAIGTILIAILTACSGAYYAFFTCACLAFAGVYSRRLSSLAAIGIIVVVGWLNHLPTTLYQAKYGPNTEVTQRQPEEAEEYGLKLAPMLLPTQNHHWKWLRDIRAKYDSDHRVLQNENETATLGMIGSMVFIALMAMLFLRMRDERLEPLAWLILFLVLLGTVGGLGSLFNFFVTPAVRSLNRISIVIAWFVFVALAIAWERTALSLAAKRVIAVLVALIGVVDETPRGWFRPRNDAEIQKRWHDDREFFQSFPEGPVLCLPMIPYPETFAVGKLAGYDHVRGYLHSVNRWSFGAMKGREADQWQRELERLPFDEQLKRAKLAGFRSAFVDLRGYATPPGLSASARHPDGKQARFDLGEPTNHDWQQVRALWFRGFVSFESIGHEAKHRWCGRHGTMILANPFAEPRAMKLAMVLGSSTQALGELTISSDEVWNARERLTSTPRRVEYDVVVPPGRHTVRFEYVPPREHTPRDARDNVFFIAEFSMIPR